MSSRWLNDSTRRAIYTRDNDTCCYCGKACIRASYKGMSKEEKYAFMRTNHNMIITLDHIVPQKQLAAAATNDAHFRVLRRDPKNLVAVCNQCNSSKQDTELYVWCAQQGFDYSSILTRIAERVSKSL